MAQNLGSTDDLAKLLKGMESLKKIEVVNTIQVGTPAKTEKKGVADNSNDTSLFLFFDNEKEQKSISRSFYPFSICIATSRLMDAGNCL